MPAAPILRTGRLVPVRAAWLKRLTPMAVAAGLLAMPSPALARDDAVQRACYPPSVLAAQPGEQALARGDRRFDMPGKIADAPPLPAVAAGMRGAIRRVDLAPGQKFIALTLDLCESRGEVAGYEGRIFDYLRKESVKATVFAGGKWMRSHRPRAEQLMSDPLFELANHSDTHRNLRTAPPQRIGDEIVNPQRTYHAIRTDMARAQCIAGTKDAMSSVPGQMRLFRFPFGACNPASLAAVKDAGLLAIQWDLSTGDPDPRSTAQQIANRILKRVTPGSIIIAHANGRGWNTADALPLVIPKLKALGYTFVTVSELLARGKPVIAESCYDSRPGDTDRYDVLSGLRAAAGQKPAASDSGGGLPWLERSLPPADGREPRKGSPK